MLSDFKNEIIAIAIWNNQKAGLARLVKIDEKNFELGGVYVFENYRGKKIAKELIKFLLKFVNEYQKVYCIPFEYLTSFYEQFGFIKCSNLENVVKGVIKKYEWCQNSYSHKTSLLIMDN